MAKFLTTHGVASEIERLIVNARKRLILVTPFLKLSTILLERLQDAGRRQVSVILVYGKAELSGREKTKLSRIPGLDLRFSEHLHAKCYCNEDAMVITSMNLHEFSEKNNREVGVLLVADERAYRDGIREIESIIDNSSVGSSDSSPSSLLVSERITGSRLQKRELVISHVDSPAGGKNPHVVCHADGIGRIAFWGRTNIELLRSWADKTPFVVRCHCRGANNPKHGANNPNHDAWVPESQKLEFIVPK